MKHSRKLDLPPGYSGHILPPGESAFAHACAIAGEQGAGAFVHARKGELIEFAVVLEPDEPLASARRGFFACMHALAEAISAHCPPEREVAFHWPDAIIFDGGLVGGGLVAVGGAVARSSPRGGEVESTSLPDCDRLRKAIGHLLAGESKRPLTRLRSPAVIGTKEHTPGVGVMLRSIVRTAESRLEKIA
jgi:hypothetical protein